MTDAEQSLPSVLYHYTDAYGLVGIVKETGCPIEYENPELLFPQTAKLLASDVRYMNDTEELRFGVRLMLKHLEAAAAPDSGHSEEFRTLAGQLRGMYDLDRLFAWKLRAFATCFCRSGDLLSQWRGYAGGTGGFAIGFNFQALKERSYTYDTALGPNGGLGPTRLLPVVYGEKAEPFAAQVIDGIRHTLELKRYVHDGRTGRVLPFYPALEIIHAAAAMKHEAFEEEKEWRLFSVHEPQFPASVAARGRGLVPYMEIGVNVNTPDKPRVETTIADLVVGPCPDQPAQVSAARELLKANGHDPEVVRASNAPFRG